MKQSLGKLRVDFVCGAVAHRLRFGGGRGQALAKAMGLRAGKTPSVIDATAGLGRDSFLLASLGAQVTLIERSEQMHTLLVQGMERARQEGGEFSEIMDRMTLLQGDAKDLLPGLFAEAILIDPMHPPRTNSALVKRDADLSHRCCFRSSDMLTCSKPTPPINPPATSSPPERSAPPSNAPERGRRASGCPSGSPASQPQRQPLIKGEFLSATAAGWQTRHREQRANCKG